MSAENPRGKGAAESSTDATDKTFSCDYCDTQFTTIHAKRRHERNFHPSELEYECPSCNATFHTLSGKNNHHISVHGESIAGVETTCKHCGDTYRVARSVVDDSNFCSKSCLYNWRSENQSGKDNPLYSRVIVECSYCGTDMERYPYQVERFENLYCSRSCKGNWMSENRVGEDNHKWKDNTVTFECEQCGDEYENTLDQADRTRFCSQKCLTDWQSENLSGENSVHWIHGYGYYYGADWRRKRRKARARDGYECQDCGVPESNLTRELDVHHIIPFRKFESADDANDLDNLVSLCRSCHKKWEGIPLRPQ